jgi:DNA-directed RNA polymerase subunit RPC12/RpoP
MMTKILQKETIKINCPHCKLERTDVWICEINSVIGQRFAYICGNCEKLLGISKQPILTSHQFSDRRYFQQN